MTHEQIGNTLQCWSTDNLINYIFNLQEVMYSACKVSLDLCETCDIDPCERCAEICPNHKLREDIRKVQPEVLKVVGKDG